MASAGVAYALSIMAELRERWLAQAQLMRDEFSKHRCPGQERRPLLEAAEKTVSRSFLSLGFVVSQSVIVFLV